MKILVTGGASGVGRAITRKLAEVKGNTVYFTFNSSMKKAKELTSEFSNLVAIKCNYSEQEEVVGLCKLIEDEDVDVLVNNAYNGTFLQTYFHKTDPQKYLSEFQTNLLPTIQVTQAAISTFRKKKKGKIITILSDALSNTPPVGSSIYVANKAYLKELTKVWATENAKFNITSNSISPSMMITEMTQTIDERLIEQIIEKHPLKKLLTPEEVADTALFLVHASPHINGVNILMNAAENIN